MSSRVPIGHCVDRCKTWNPPIDDPSGEMLYIDISSVDKDTKRITAPVEIACSEAPSRARQLVAAGDILVSTVRPNLNGVAVVPPELHGATASTGYTVLRPRAEIIHGPYLFQWTKNPIFVDEMVRLATGASYPAVSDKIVRDSTIPLPPLPEQRRIAAILDKADALRAKRREAIAKLDQLLQSVFLDMFGDPRENPKGFPIRKLSDFYISSDEGTRCGPFGTALQKSDITESGVPLWNMDNISVSGKMELPFRAWVSAEKAKQLAGYRVADGDILISRAGTVGKMCVVRTNEAASLMTTNLIRLRLGPELIPEFFVALMTYCKGKVGRLKSGPDGAFTHMSTGILDSLVFPYPAVHLQRAWAKYQEIARSHEARLMSHLQLFNKNFDSIAGKSFGSHSGAVAT